MALWPANAYALPPAAGASPPSPAAPEGLALPDTLAPYAPASGDTVRAGQRAVPGGYVAPTKLPLVSRDNVYTINGMPSLPVTP